jgi:hypothetical protein
MNEGNVGLLALAHQLAPYYCTNPKVAAMAVERSVACGYADRFSDLDLVVFWSQPPTEKEGREIVKRAGGRHLQLVPSKGDDTCWSDTYEVSGVIIDTLHTTVEATERLLADVLERHKPSLTKQQHIAALLSALPLANPAVLSHWQERHAGSARLRKSLASSSVEKDTGAGIMLSSV